MPPWTLLIDPLSRLLDRLIPDPEARAKAQLELLKTEREQDLQLLRDVMQGDQSQAAVNQQEASSPSLFVSGWRPFIGWICGAAFAYHFMLQPLLAFLIANIRGDVELPSFDMETLTTVLMGMLGLSSLRTIEKLRNRG